MKHLKKILLILTLSLVTSACATGVSTYPVADDTNGYTLGAGDTLRITVFGQENLSGEFTIEPNGMVSFPLIKEVPAAGMTARELEKTLTSELSPDYVVDARVTVEVINYRDMYILGEVQLPGKYDYVPNMTVLQAVAIAGGYTYRADESGAEITRHVKGALKTFTVNEKTMLKPGDTIVIKRRWF